MIFTLLIMHLHCEHMNNISPNTNYMYMYIIKYSNFLIRVINVGGGGEPKKNLCVEHV